MKIDWQSHYAQLNQLVAEMPGDLTGTASVSGETYRWLGRVSALLEEQEKGGDFDTMVVTDRIAFNSAADGLQGVLRPSNANQIIAIIHRALARAEARAPAAPRGSFVAIGAGFSAVQAISKVLRDASKEVLFIEPYADAVLLTDFAPLAGDAVTVGVLIDPATSKIATLKPVAERWAKQHGAARPLEVRTSSPRALHDRLIIIDGGVRVWSVSQSYNHLAARSPASVVPLDTELAKAKRAHYVGLWAAAPKL